VHSIIGAKGVEPDFVQVDADFAMNCGFCAGYTWLPERKESGNVVVEEEANARRTCALKCALL
jgi:hypothetical protein